MLFVNRLVNCQLTTRKQPHIVGGLMGREKHPKKEIEAAVQYAEGEFWRCKLGGARAWGKLYCPYHCAACRC